MPMTRLTASANQPGSKSLDQTTVPRQLRHRRYARRSDRLWSKGEHFTQPCRARWVKHRETFPILDHFPSFQECSARYVKGSSQVTYDCVNSAKPLWVTIEGWMLTPNSSKAALWLVSRLTTPWRKSVRILDSYYSYDIFETYPLTRNTLQIRQYWLWHCPIAHHFDGVFISNGPGDPVSHFF